MVDRHRLIGECRKLKQDGVDLESVVAAALCADPEAPIRPTAVASRCNFNCRNFGL